MRRSLNASFLLFDKNALKHLYFSVDSKDLSVKSATVAYRVPESAGSEILNEAIKRKNHHLGRIGDGHDVCSVENHQAAFTNARLIRGTTPDRDRLPGRRIGFSPRVSLPYVVVERFC